MCVGKKEANVLVSQRNTESLQLLCRDGCLVYRMKSKRGRPSFRTSSRESDQTAGFRVDGGVRAATPAEEALSPRLFPGFLQIFSLALTEYGKKSTINSDIFSVF